MFMDSAGVSITCWSLLTEKRLFFRNKWQLGFCIDQQDGLLRYTCYQII